MSQLQENLKNLNVNRIDLDSAVELSASAYELRTSYARHQVPSPPWLDDAIRTLDRHITDLTRDRMEMELREIAQQDAADMTATERREVRAKRRAELESRLGKPAAAQVTTNS